jgi:hypothetical protein
MKNFLEEELIKFKSISVQIIDYLRNEEYDGIDKLLNDRSEVIEHIQTLTYRQTDFNDVAANLGLLDTERELTVLLSQKKQEVRELMNKVNTVKKANNNYQRNFHSDSLFFNKKI